MRTASSELRTMVTSLCVLAVAFLLIMWIYHKLNTRQQETLMSWRFWNSIEIKSFTVYLNKFLLRYILDTNYGYLFRPSLISTDKYIWNGQCFLDIIFFWYQNTWIITAWPYVITSACWFWDVLNCKKNLLVALHCLLTLNKRIKKMIQNLCEYCY